VRERLPARILSWIWWCLDERRRSRTAKPCRAGMLVAHVAACAGMLVAHVAACAPWSRCARLVFHGLTPHGNRDWRPVGLAWTADDFCWRRACAAEEHDGGAPGHSVGAYKAVLRAADWFRLGRGRRCFLGGETRAVAGRTLGERSGAESTKGRRFALAIPETSSTIGTVMEISDSGIRFLGLSPSLSPLGNGILPERPERLLWQSRTDARNGGLGGLSRDPHSPAGKG
jgi:hypothetical protein